MELVNAFIGTGNGIIVKYYWKELELNPEIAIAGLVYHVILQPEKPNLKMIMVTERLESKLAAINEEVSRFRGRVPM